MIEMCISFEPAPVCPSRRKNTHQAEIAATVVNGERYEARSRSSCEAALARMLVEAGVPDQPWQTVNATGTVCLRGKSIHRLAQRTVEEPDDGRLRAARFQPRLPIGTTPVLAAHPLNARQPTARRTNFMA